MVHMLFQLLVQQQLLLLQEHLLLQQVTLGQLLQLFHLLQLTLYSLLLDHKKSFFSFFIIFTILWADKAILYQPFFL